MKKILLIEDNTELRENTAEILELAGFDVKTAKNGKEGVELVTSQAPDLIICDIMMPELDGYGVLHILSRKESTRNIPFIFMTAKAEKSDIRKGMNLGADDYLTKPFDDTELLDTVETRLSKANIARQDNGQKLEGFDDFVSDLSSMHDLEDLKRQRKIRRYKKKKDIYLEGDIPLYLLYVNEGKVKTSKTNEDGKELIIGIHVQGDFFGYESLLEGEYGETATTLEESELVLIPKSDFLELINSNLQVSRKFVDILSKKVAKMEKQLLDLAYDTVRQRTAKALIEVYEKYSNDGEQISFHMSREDLANMVGTATETVIRALSDFKEEKLVLSEFGKTKITDLDKLNIVAKRNFAF